MTTPRPFAGFDARPMRWVPLPAPLFQQVFPQVQDVETLRAVLYVFWRFTFDEASVHFLRDDEAADDGTYWGHLGATPQERLPRVRAALDAAVDLGVLLVVEHQGQRYYFLNSPKGRSVVAAFRQGRWQPDRSALPPPEAVDRSNIFRLYEENFGPLTPLLADRLRDALERYPEPWIVEAMSLAVARNVRRWRYVEAILERWLTEGRDDRASERHSQTDVDKYRRDPYARFFE